jgi:hypothetical protein
MGDLIDTRTVQAIVEEQRARDQGSERGLFCLELLHCIGTPPSPCSGTAIARGGRFSRDGMNQLTDSSCGYENVGGVQNRIRSAPASWQATPK